MIVAIIGTAVMLVAVVSIIGHILHDSGYYQWWGDPVGMATNTAVCFVSIGIALLVVGLSSDWH